MTWDIFLHLCGHEPCLDAPLGPNSEPIHCETQCRLAVGNVGLASFRLLVWYFPVAHGLSYLCQTTKMAGPSLLGSMHAPACAEPGRECPPWEGLLHAFAEDGVWTSLSLALQRHLPAWSQGGSIPPSARASAHSHWEWSLGQPLLWARQGITPPN